ncbi:MAG: chemotaxis protein CheD [Halothiobacillaceae bacterium]|nr:MAG: chemotaxis protein CheD [Halothiobacillaceae bacterium]
MTKYNGIKSDNDDRVVRGFEAINRYWDNELALNVAKILPGEYYVTIQNEGISTVLGSCISACVRDRLFGVGGMNHFMLPLRGESGGGGAEPFGAAERYGNYAMEHLINDILKNGGRRENLEIKVFGGGKILAQMTDVGSRNIQFVKEYLHTEGLKVVAEDVGDSYPRKVLYFPATGKVMLKKLRSLHNNTIAARETTYMQDLHKEPVTGEIDLF